MGLPVKIAQGQSRYQPRRKELIDVMRVEVLDCRCRRKSVGQYKYSTEGSLSEYMKKRTFDFGGRKRLFHNEQLRVNGSCLHDSGGDE